MVDGQGGGGGRVNVTRNYVKGNFKIIISDIFHKTKGTKELGNLRVIFSKNHLKWQTEKKLCKN